VRILVVEDDDSIASFVTKGLGAEGHTADRASTLTDAAALLAADGYDVVLLDLILPDGDGRELLPPLRAEHPDLPVIVLSAVADVDEKVELLDLGADDYLTKPFAFAELTARIRANIRHGNERSDVITVGDLSLDTRTRVARRGDLRVDLPSREYALLAYLMRHPDQVLSRQQILDAVWGFDFEPGSNVVDVYVGYLRRKLDSSEGASNIETVRGAGYRVRS
jgi:DNA-binding response OmpR family regulator